ncbi:PAAR domain-containing protein [Serratia oryzae]|uniref:PAAR domain-containing protein n=1 Tax=Serratia oryzae TaxID=2034155 RepID=A0A1S8CHL3_9GAMM|nr:PAAR domain-containing protein [Serratia oryzae]OMQ21469.1 hypothetical protein BMI79_15435 [Serratia oryzae]
MAKGHYLVIQDKTTCGGIITEGDTTHTLFGRAIAREQDRVTCGKHPGMFIIVGHIPGDSVMGRKFAGTLHSKSSCPCQARFIPSMLMDTYELTRASYPASSKEPEQPVQPSQVQEQTQREPVDAGFCVLPYGATAEGFEPWLFKGTPPAGTKELYRSLNGNNQFKAGSILLLVDPLKQDGDQIAHMQKAKARVDTALAPLTHEEANFLHRNKDTIDLFTSQASLSVGVASEAAGKYFERVESILAKIQTTYKNQYISSGTLISQQFYVERRALFNELDSVLTSFTKHKIGLKDYPDIKRALGLSSSSIMHRWNQTGVSDIEGYATYMENAAKYVKIMKQAGYVGIGLDGVNRLDKIYEACTVGSDCAKTTYTEVGSFAGGIGLGLWVGQLAATSSTAVCSLVLGAITAEVGGVGMLACGIIFTGAVGYGSSEVGDKVGGAIGEKVYEVTK